MTNLRPYLEVTKPKLVSLLVFTAFAGMVLAAHATGASVSLAAWAQGLAVITLACAGANATTCYLDRDIDARMDRTSRRPLPRGSIDPPERALYWGLALILVALFLAWMQNLLAFSAIALGVLDNVVVYSALTKRRSPLNIILGSFSGGLPVVYGWAFVAGSINLVPILMAALVVLWTPNHIWSLAVRYRGDYARAGVPMLPVVMGEAKAIRCIAVTAFLLVAFSVALDPLGSFGSVYLGVAAGMGAAVVALNAWLWANPTPRKAWVVFKFSSPYLAVLFAAMIVSPYLLR